MRVVRRAPQEWQEQAALMAWAQLHESREPRLRLLFHIANGEYRSKQTAAKLQQMGVKAGVPDLFLPVPMHPWYGCFLEMKRAVYPSTAATHQARWHTHLTAQGYDVWVAAGWLDAAQHLCWYLQRKDLLAALEGGPYAPTSSG